VICPADNAAEAAVVAGVDVIGVRYLTEAMGFLNEGLPLEPVGVNLEAVFAAESRYEVDFSDVRGQESAKRALTIAAAGHHNPGPDESGSGIGPPGSGKTVYVGHFSYRPDYRVSGDRYCVPGTPGGDGWLPAGPLQSIRSVEQQRRIRLDNGLKGREGGLV